MIVDEAKLITGLKARKIDQGLITTLTEEAKATSTPFYDVVQQKHVLPDEELGKLVAEIIGYPYINLSGIEISNEVLEIVPENIALKQGIITFGIDEEKNQIKIATINPFDLEIIHDLENKIGKEAVVYYTTHSNIKNIIGKYHQELRNVFLNMLPEHLRYKKADELTESGVSENLEEEIPIVKIFDTLLLHAYRHHASDIHIEATKENTVIRYRVDGILQKIVSLPKIIHEPFITRCKILSNLRIDETRAAQDGRIAMKLDNDNIAFRVSILPTHFGEKVVMRLLVDIQDSIDLIESGLSKKNYSIVVANSTKPYGMMIVTGPTGSGKTTTLYNVIKMLNSEKINISTIEDPIEYGIEGINQVQVNTATDLTFANGLRSLLRQDPDCILVGEIRDKETAQIAVESAMTGHMVFTTLHANSTSVGVPRLVEMGIEPFLLGTAINCLIAQRLVRKNCEHCREDQSYTTDMLKNIYVDRDIVEIIKKIKQKNTESQVTVESEGGEYLFKRGTGCQICSNTGYKGRVGLYEVMEVDDSIKSIILRGGTADEIEDKAVENGMITMLESGLEKVLNGDTSLEEIIRVIKG